MKKRTSLQVYSNTLDKLHNHKKRGESYEDVILRLLQEHEDNIISEKNK